MNRHLTMEELLSLRDGDTGHTVRAHLDACPDCAREHDRLGQRMGALRALGTRRPPRDRWPVVKAQLSADRRRQGIRRGAVAVTAVAASLILAIGLKPATSGDKDPTAAAVPASIATFQTQSQQLEALLASYGPDGRVMDGRTAAVIADLEDRIALVDAGLMQARRVNAPTHDVADLWRGRVQLMDALVNAHVARASYVGF